MPRENGQIRHSNARSDGLECWKPSTPRICVTFSSGNGHNPRLFGAHPGNPSLTLSPCLDSRKCEILCCQLRACATTGFSLHPAHL
jgi:hypothetical protein